jgi:methylase of polypeptide subunit release factors
LKEEKMTEQQEWDKERAEQHARWAKMASRLSYAPFAKRIVRSLAPLERDSTIVDLGTGPGILSIELNKLLPQAKIIGVDLSSDMLEIAKKNPSSQIPSTWWSPNLRSMSGRISARVSLRVSES